MSRSVMLAVFLAWGWVLPSAAQEGPPRGVQANPHGDTTFELACENCHLTQAWRPLKAVLDFDHSTQANYPLEGAHTSVACLTCHTEARFDEPKDPECATCHTDVHAGSLGTDCARCHDSNSFQVFDALAVHNQTLFPLTGAHMQTQCADCHQDDAGGAFSPLDPACAHCHRDDYDNAVSIDHREFGFSLECEDCHQTLAWAGSGLFDHVTQSGGFSLIGAHAIIRCATCHSGPGFTVPFAVNSPEQCLTCHEADYQVAHSGSGFSTQCLTCHNSDSWGDARLRDHDSAYFPIYSGTHKGEWDSCSSCHQGDPSYQTFSCLNCHAHRQSAMDSKHRGRSGYAYDSLLCYSCHRNGKGD